uniref:tumor necrosis factor alpha-induced protein 8-like protein 2 n=1 Tax=Euleptes europaea TaxID=460621 RepID=UPI00253FC743|nr:tumor necrosis factor alpha-induced protein 8-like protein 2 [Euleptes europaea]
METFSSRSLAIQAEKKILSRMASKSMANMFIDDTSSEILDEIYRVSKEYTQNRAESQKVIKNLIKMTVKISVLYRNNCFSDEELCWAAEFKHKLHQGAMTAISFHEVDFTFEKAILAKLLQECRDLLLKLVENHLTPKSLGRIRHVFDHFADTELLTRLYSPGEPYQPRLKKICEGLNRLIDEGKL